jgi:DNA mismatch endonuclease (patch repair protein)
MMSRIKGTNTRPETELRKALHRLGLRFRLHDRDLPGRPDIVLSRWKAVIFVHGCFWHQHQGCRYATMPATRPEFWSAKFEANKARDERSLTELKALGWRTAIVWECALRRGGDSNAAANLAEWLATDSPSLEEPVWPSSLSHGVR